MLSMVSYINIFDAECVESTVPLVMPTSGGDVAGKDRMDISFTIDSEVMKRHGVGVDKLF